jgi:ABC-2 type transport system ATP-binding protein
LIDKTNTYVNQLSGGERQKIAIILALIANPQVIILDELTTGLDPKSRREMWECIKNLKREGRTVFMTTHYMEEAAYLCDQIGIMNKGKLIAIDSVEGIIDKADIDITISFETEDDVFHIIKDELNKKINKIEINNTKVKIYTKSEDVLTDLIILLRDKKFNYRKIDIKRPTLEDAYLKLVGKEKETEGNATI